MSLLVYYGHDESLLERLREASVLVFEPRGWSDEALAKLAAPGGPRLLGYLSAFAWPDWAGPRRWWWGRPEFDAEWNAWWLSLRSWGWRYQVRRLWRPLRRYCDGLFLDNLDRLEQDPRSLAPFLALLQRLRAEWPEVYLLGNRGFSHQRALRPYLDGVLFENLTDRNFDLSDRDWVRAQLEQLKFTKTDVFALDYADRFAPEEAAALQGLYPEMLYWCAPDQSLQELG